MHEKYKGTYLVLNELKRFGLNEDFKIRDVKGKNRVVAGQVPSASWRQTMEYAGCVEATERPKQRENGTTYSRVAEPDAEGICTKCRYFTYCPILGALQED